MVECFVCPDVLARSILEIAIAAFHVANVRNVSARTRMERDYEN